MLRRYVVDSGSMPAGCDGDLSFDHGFLPRRLRLRPLGGSHAAWEQAAAELPRLALDRRAQKVLAQIPPLGAGPEDLADEDVKRAATVLGMIAHSYWRFGFEPMFAARNSEILDDLPPAIKEPWSEVCRRLGRSGPALTLEDWVFNNLTLRNGESVGPCGEYRVGAVRAEEVRLQVPAYGNEVERIFTGAFAEVHSAIAPVVRAGCVIEEAIADGGLDAANAVRVELEEIARCARRAMTAFRKVNPRSDSRTFCDPVDWAKSMATWAVPPPGYPAGPSGSASPFVHFFDALIGRSAYSSRLGRFAWELRGTQLPHRLEGFFDLVRRVDVRGYVEGLSAVDAPGAQSVREAFNGVVSSFSGPDGFLGVHKGKAVDYLGVGTVVGRNQSTGHDQTHLAAADWTVMADDLRESIGERHACRLDA